MPKNLVIGSPIQTYDLNIRRESVGGFVINWFEDDEHTVPRVDIDGKTFTVIVGTRSAPIQSWTAVAESNVTSFFLTEEGTNLPFKIYDGLIMMSVGVDDSVLVNLKIVIDPD